MFWMRKRNFQSKYTITEPLPGSRVLDFGCGNGEFLGSIEALTSYSLGFDFTLEQVPENLKAKPHLEFVDNVDLLISKGPFDRIFLLQAIEHLPSPVETLKLLRTVLDIDGQIIIETPSRTGWDSKIPPYKFWGGWHAPRHFHIWDKESLDKLSEKLDLRIASTTYIPSPYQWAETLKPRVHKIFRSLVSSEKIFFVALFYSVDLCQIILGKKTSNIRVVFVQD